MQQYLENKSGCYLGKDFSNKRKSWTYQQYLWELSISQFSISSKLLRIYGKEKKIKTGISIVWIINLIYAIAHYMPDKANFTIIVIATKYRVENNWSSTLSLDTMKKIMRLPRPSPAAPPPPQLTATGAHRGPYPLPHSRSSPPQAVSCGGGAAGGPSEWCYHYFPPSILYV